VCVLFHRIRKDVEPHKLCEDVDFGEQRADVVARYFELCQASEPCDAYGNAADGGGAASVLVLLYQ
jgi:hypothetical protein